MINVVTDALWLHFSSLFCICTFREWCTGTIFAFLPPVSQTVEGKRRKQT